MQRYFIPSTDWHVSEVIIKGDDAHHISRVMRYKEGDKIICNHTDGIAAICEITAIDQSIHATVREWLDEAVELPITVTVAQGLPKGDKFDLILQKGTELGAHSFIPFQAERSIVVWDEKKKAKKMNRFRKIVKEASEQSHRKQIPVIHSPMTLSDLIEESTTYDMKIFPYEEEAKTEKHQSFGSIMKRLERDHRLFICIGPEGGFSVKEAEKLKESGFHPVRLGPRILRTETAAIYVLSSISYQFEEL
ncbi:16S rRNA (uracil(1498)-N(3))-methyltransferase [Virgibacillus sp. NKC19-16]|uniref:16S rRNA (uracil(1498)-N(3))-methyltransferase n=1 Tax=Virgibacillus salidurans TaxID=2831673 RepID=UPI001F430325|nr:16S rRNA (uracil(1498)-N(3))-methyltransferase [Virgibacillus sp. NKC19-16]UJL44883.1 16S rRNA (uracil(1498)-N(3))-methyltransferase [Virgibacillus sp. NKC19-16]